MEQRKSYGTKRYLAISYAFFLDTLVVVLEIFLIALLIAAQAFVLFFTVYQIVISMLGMIARTKKIPLLTDRNHRFALVVAAHNEEEVVGQIVDNLKELEYPRELYDIYVICDNCTDGTADVAREHESIAMERFDPEKRGKGYGLEWMFAHLWEFEKKGIRYDAVAMFDADNLADKKFLRIMNQRLNQGFEVIQGYLDTKNPNDTWITKSYAFAYWSTNRIFQLARERIGLSAQLGGTGLVVSTNILRDIGWGATSLTEDLEFTVRYILKTGRRVAWAHEAKVYDEKPLQFKTTWRQRIRWMQGHIDCMIRYTIPLLKASFVKRSWIAFDAAVYLAQPARTFLSLSAIGFFVLALFASIWNYQYLFLSRWVWLTILLVYFSLPIVGLILEGKAKAISWYLFSYVFSVTWLPVTIMGFIRRKERTWHHTKHTRSMSNEEIKGLLRPK
jgi:cellulose synthase/poly-beta-1,6-N-acetylglucosamine synthase-like glycosyltransferase